MRAKQFAESTHRHFMKWFRRAYRAFMTLKGYKLKVLGNENVPAEGSVIITPNHKSAWDPFAILWAMNQRLPGAVGKKSLFHIPVIGQVIRLADIFPVPHGKKAKEGVKQGPVSKKTKDKLSTRIFNKNRMLLIFPEGGVYQGDTVDELRSGAVSMAIKYGVPLLPCGIAGLEKGKRNGLIVVSYGKSIDVLKWMFENDYSEVPSDEEERRSMYARFNEEVLRPAIQAEYNTALRHCLTHRTAS